MLSFASWEAERRRERLSRQQQNKKRQRKNEGSNNNIDVEPSDASQIAASLPQSQSNPLHYAIHHDLMAIRSRFCAAIREVPQPDNHRNAPAKTGQAFAVFQKVAKSARLSMLHNLVPPKCDASSFSQLIYSVCLDMLDDNSKSGNEPNEPNNKESEEAFAIFALYTLHETSPLSLAPGSSFAKANLKEDGEQTTSLLSALPMGLTNRQNPRLLFRRNYRPAIRVGPETYTRLLALRQACSGRPHEILARDVCEVLDCLWPRLVLVAYPGPMGLHGLSQRQIRRQELVSQRENAVNPAVAAHASDTAVENESTNGKDEDQESKDLLQDRMQSHLKCLSKLRLPPPNSKKQRFRSLRQAMQPMMRTDQTDQNNGVRGWEESLQNVLRDDGKEEADNESAHSRSQNDNDKSEKAATATRTTRLERPAPVVTFALPADADVSKDGGAVEDNNGETADDTDHKLPAASQRFDLVLPSGVDGSLQRSLESLVQSLANRYDKTIFHQIPLSASGNDDMSTLGGFSHGMQHSVAASSVGTASAVGRSALQALLAQVTEETGGAKHQHSLNRKDPTSFLEGDNDEEEPDNKRVGKKTHSKKKKGRGKTAGLKRAAAALEDDISDMSDDDAFSAAGVSTVGRQALEDLIQEASIATKPARKKRSPQKAAAKRNKSPPAAKPRTTGQRKEGTKTTRARRQPNKKNKNQSFALTEEDGSSRQSEEPSSSSSSDLSSLDEQNKDDARSKSGGSISGLGNAALETLLQRALADG